MPTIKKHIECQSCDGTGVYSGMGEKAGVAVVCYKCKGTGRCEYKFSYKKFTGLKKRDDIKRVYLNGYGYAISTGKLKFQSHPPVVIDMDKEGVSYDEFVAGKLPTHIKQLACPMVADQGACHKIKGFTDRCMELNDGWIGTLTKCKNQKYKNECWLRFEEGK